MNSFNPNATFLHPLFSGVEKWCIGNEWVNQCQQLLHSFYQISWMAIIQGGNWLDENFPGGNLLCGNYPGGSFSVWELSGWNFSGWQFSRWQFSWVGVVLVGIFWVGVFLGRNCAGGTYPGWEFSLVEVFRVGIFRWESSVCQIF